MANIKLGRTGISGLKLGTHNVGKVFKGDAQIWPARIENYSFDFTTGVLDPRFNYSAYSNEEFVQGGITCGDDEYGSRTATLGHSYNAPAVLSKAEFTFTFKRLGLGTNNDYCHIGTECWGSIPGSTVSMMFGGINADRPSEGPVYNALYVSNEDWLKDAVATNIVEGQTYNVYVAVRFTGDDKKIYASKDGNAKYVPLTVDYSDKNLMVGFIIQKQTVCSHMDVTLHFGTT